MPQASAPDPADPARRLTIHERLAARLIDDGRIGVIGLDPELRVCFANLAGAQLAGGTAAEIVGRSALDLIHPDDLHMISTSLEQVLHGRHALPTLFRVNGADGVERLTEGTVQSVDAADDELAYVATLRDPTHALSLDAFVEGVLQADIDNAMRALVRLMQSEGGYLGSIHWGRAGGRFANEVALDEWVQRAIHRPDFRTLMMSITHGVLGNVLAPSLGIDTSGSPVRSVLAVPFGAPPHEGLVVAWLPYDGLLGPAGRALFVRVAKLASIALERHMDDVRLRAAAHSDPLTGLSNRTALRECIEGALQDQRPFALLLLDLDGFKSINDGYGHATGDDVLIEVARRLRRVVPSGSTAARLGGDEFALVVDGANDPLVLSALAARVEQDVAMPMSTRSGELEVGVSVGAVSSVGHACVDELLALADRAMYAIKRGRPRRHVTVR